MRRFAGGKIVNQSEGAVHLSCFIILRHYSSPRKQFKEKRKKLMLNMTPTWTGSVIALRSSPWTSGRPRLKVPPRRRAWITQSPVAHSIRFKLTIVRTWNGKMEEICCSSYQHISKFPSLKRISLFAWMQIRTPLISGRAMAKKRQSASFLPSPQRRFSQFPTCLSSPIHFFPPFLGAGSVHCLVLVCFPRSHDTLQDDHADHLPQWPSTGAEK